MTQVKSEDQPPNADGGGRKTRPDPAAAPGPKPQEQSPRGGGLGAGLEQFETIVAKGLSLADASLGLAVTLIGRVTAAAQQQMDGAMPSAAGPVPGQAPPPGAWPADASGAPSPQPPPEPAYGITNRLPLVPGGSVQISFAINNESLTQPKNVEVRVEGFAGDTHGVSISAEQFKVKPARKTIAPVDFEKFFLNGTVPAGVAPDVYRGWVVVLSDTELKIPVVLVVTPL
jgi:hypothetical protein